MAMPQHGMMQPNVTQALSPSSRPLRAPPLQPTFGYPERDREPPVRISQKPPPPEHQQPRPLAAAQPLQTAQPGHPEQSAAERQKMEMQPKEHHRPIERTRLPTEAEPGSHHPYEPFSLHQRPMHGGPQRGEPLPPQGRLPLEPPRGPLSAPPPFSQPVPQQGVRGLLSDPPQAQTTTPPAQRPISAAQRQMSSHLGEPYPPRQQSPTAAAV